MSLVKSSVAFPQPVLEWLDAEADRHGMSRNAYLTHLLMREKSTQLNERLDRLEKRLAALESAPQQAACNEIAAPMQPTGAAPDFIPAPSGFGDSAALRSRPPLRSENQA